MSTEAQALINFYAREGLYRHIQAVCNDGLRKRGDDPILIFWKSFALVKEGNISEAIRDLETIKHKKELSVAVTTALLSAHSKFARVERDAVNELQSKLKEDQKSTNEVGLLNVAYFHLHNGDHDKAREYVKVLLDQQPQYLPGQVLMGWIDLTCGRAVFAKKSLQFFEKALSTGTKKDIEALLGKAKYLELVSRQPSQALEVLNQVIVLFAWFLPALTEKAKLLLSTGDWDQACETCNRVLSQDSYNIEALKIVALYSLCKSSKYSESASRISELIQAIDRFEPKNPALYLSVAKVMSRIAGRDPQVLQQTVTLVDRAKVLSADGVAFTEYGNQLLMLGNVKEAHSAFKNAMKLDETNESAVHGSMLCQILDGQYVDVANQLSFMLDLAQSAGKTPELTFLCALLAWRKDGDREASIKLLSEAIELHFKTLQDVSLSLEYYSRFNPDFLMQVSEEMLIHCGTDPLELNEIVPPITNKAMKLLDIISKAVPGMIHCIYLLAKMKYITNDDETALRILEQVLKLNPAYSEAHMLISQLYLKQDKAKQAMQALEQALSHNFEVRESAHYFLVKAKVHEQLGEYDEELHVLEEAMEIPGVKQAEPANTRKKQAFPVSLYDRVSIYLGLASAFIRQNRMRDVAKVMEAGAREFKGTAEEVRFIIANADFAIKRGDPDLALGLLSQVTPEKVYFIKAQTVMANIYLQHRSDKRMYVNCYKKLVEIDPSLHHLLLLGEAYMKIQEPDQAIQVYHKALEQNPGDAGICSKIGKAMITTHDYNKAVAYYESAVKDNPTSPLRHELAELYIKLKRFDQAESLLRDSLGEKRDSPAEYQGLISDVKIYMLMYKVHAGAGANAKSVDALQKARELQNSLLVKIRGEQPDFVKQQRHIAANICYQLAVYYDQHNSAEKAQGFYNESLKHNETHEKSHTALARLCLARGDLENCQHHCLDIIRMDAGNEEASMMLADLMFRKNEAEMATYHYHNLLEKKPNHYVALSRLIELLRRGGKLADVPKFLKMAQSQSKRAAMEPGLHYCKGLYSRYTNNPREALTEFYAARKDSDWGEKVLFHMIEIYLNPDNETVSSEDKKEDDKDKSEQLKAINSAKELLRELPQRPKSLKHQVLECYAQMATRSKQDIEEALQNFGEILNQDRNYVPAMLGMAQAYILKKENPKARNQLKRISKMNYNTDDAEEFERAWLLLGDSYIQNGKFDLAQEVLKKCIANNKSCAKAWELLGYIMEKEQSYRDASDYYENSWKMENESNPGIGYRLAFNYLKAKRYVEAIDICHQVLALHPDYPRIRKEILEKARSSIRS